MNLFNKKKKESAPAENQTSGNQEKAEAKSPDNIEITGMNKSTAVEKDVSFETTSVEEMAAASTKAIKRGLIFGRKKVEAISETAQPDSPSKSKTSPKPLQWFQVKKKDSETESEEKKAKPKKVKEPKPVSAPRRWRVVLVGLFVMLLFTLSGAGIGYASGIQQRLSVESQQKLVAAATHYNYGVQAMLQSNFELARKQFEYVLQIQPDFPGLKEKYTQTMVEIAKLSQPTPTPQATPTPDNRGVEALFAQAQQQVNGKQGTAALVTLDTLRNQDIHFRTLEVDALYYLALRFSGIDKIVRQADQEGGLYDLTLASRFAPLDHEAVQYATWARNYITAISYWNVDWEKVVYYLNQVFSASPGLQDSKGNSVRSRTIEALWRYGDVLMDRGKFCDAAKYYQYSLNIMQQDKVNTKYATANARCIGPALTLTASIPTAAPIVPTTPAPIIGDTPTP